MAFSLRSSTCARWSAKTARAAATRPGRPPCPGAMP